jgi:hypothetical protein
VVTVVKHLLQYIKYNIYIFIVRRINSICGLIPKHHIYLVLGVLILMPKNHIGSVTNGLGSVNIIFMCSDMRDSRSETPEKL